MSESTTIERGRFFAVIFDDGAAERLCDRGVFVPDLGEQFLVLRLEGLGVGRFEMRGLHAARQHQASGQNPQLNFQRRHDLVPIKTIPRGKA
ncbi:hypothetical protein ACVJDU_007677 [Bradyrhizobium diazoefficiens]